MNILKLRYFQVALLLCLGSIYPFTPSALAQSEPAPIVKQFFILLHSDETIREQSFQSIAANWQDGYAPMILELTRFARNQGMAVRLFELLEEKTGQQHGFEFNAWNDWLWNREITPHPNYANFKSQLYRLIDPKFAAYFDDARTSKIRLDEVVWGGVEQDGIPPLRGPKMLSAGEADYLDDDNVVFGLDINGDARAYPKRILAWHEMFVDEVGGVPVAGVYCTLCGSMILYKTVHDGVAHELGTSGFLYRSNKLMYDKATQSLWNTLWGKPVIGPLADQQSIDLEHLAVVTSTWGEWRRRHPDTKVLSLDTGHQRDYSEGAAYREYFATDDLMFTVPKRDQRLKNKDEVIAVSLNEHPDQPLAIATAYLADHPLHHEKLGEVEFVVLTDASGASRLYASGGLRFEQWDREQSLVDESGGKWTLTERSLESDDGRSLYRLPAHRAFWFGWYSAYPHTRLVN